MAWDNKNEFYLNPIKTNCIILSNDCTHLPKVLEIWNFYDTLKSSLDLGSERDSEKEPMAPSFGWATSGWWAAIIDSLGQTWLIRLTLHCESMSNKDQQGSSLGSYPTFPSPNLHFNWPSGHWPCVEPCLVGGSGKYRVMLPYSSKIRKSLFKKNNTFFFVSSF